MPMPTYRCSCGTNTTYGLMCVNCFRNKVGNEEVEKEAAAINLEDYIEQTENQED